MSTDVTDCRRLLFIARSDAGAFRGGPLGEREKVASQLSELLPRLTFNDAGMGTFTRGTAIEEVDTGPGGAYARLEEAGHTIGHYAEHVGSRMPTPEEASALQLGQGIPVITVTRVAYREDGTPLEMNDMVLPADRYELTYEWAAE